MVKILSRVFEVGSNSLYYAFGIFIFLLLVFHLSLSWKRSLLLVLEKLKGIYSMIFGGVLRFGETLIFNTNRRLKPGQ